MHFWIIFCLSSNNLCCDATLVAYHCTMVFFVFCFVVFLFRPVCAPYHNDVVCGKINKYRIWKIKPMVCKVQRLKEKQLPTIKYSAISKSKPYIRTQFTLLCEIFLNMKCQKVVQQWNMMGKGRCWTSCASSASYLNVIVTVLLPESLRLSRADRLIVSVVRTTSYQPASVFLLEVSRLLTLTCAADIQLTNVLCSEFFFL